jgi:hypothetical protein
MCQKMSRLAKDPRQRSSSQTMLVINEELPKDDYLLLSVGVQGNLEAAKSENEINSKHHEY